MDSMNHDAIVRWQHVCAVGGEVQMMKRLLENIMIILLAIQLVLGMCLLYWIARLGGIEMNDEF